MDNKYLLCVSLLINIVVMGSSGHYTPNELSHIVSTYNLYTPYELHHLKIKSLLRKIPHVKINKQLLDGIDDRQPWVERYICERIENMDEDIPLEQQELAMTAASFLLDFLTYSQDEVLYVGPLELDELLAEETVSELPKFNRYKLDHLKNNEQLQAAIQELDFQDKRDRYNFALQDAELEALP